MSSIGEKLRGERLRRGLDVYQVAEQTKINPNFLLAMEADDFDKLPGSFFARSFVRQYARALGFDDKEFEAELSGSSGPAMAPEETMPRRPAEPVIFAQTVSSRLGGLQSLGSLLAFLLTVGAIAGTYLLWQRTRDAAKPAAASAPVQQAQGPPALPPANNPTAAQQPVEQPPAEAPKPEPAAPAAPAPQPPASTSPVHLELRATAPAWVRIEKDGKLSFEGTLQAEDAKTFEAAETVRLRTGNAGALQVTWNGKPVGEIGPAGQIRTLLFTPQEYHTVAPPPATPQPDVQPEP
jgi:cytoskeletal protein RodZ